jgi:hypothetical protein
MQMEGSYGFFWTWLYAGTRLPVGPLEMDTLVPQNSCQSLKNKGIFLEGVLRKREGVTASEVMEMISLKRAQPYPEHYSVCRCHEQKLFRVVC